MAQFLSTFIVLCTTLLLVACDITNNEVAPGVSFTRIYDDPSFSNTYAPLAVVQTKDLGYLGLAATNAWNAYLFKTDQDGLLLWETKVNEAYVNPLSRLILLDGKYYMFCMNEVTLATAVIQVDPSTGTDSIIAELDQIRYPLDVSVTTDQSFLVLGYDRESKSSTLHKLDTDLQEVWSQEYAVEEDVEEMIVRHMTRTGRRLPFFTGTAANGQAYYFNGFAHYTLGLNFVNPQTGNLLGTLNGFRSDGFVSTAYPLRDNQYALARSNFGITSLLPQAAINAQAVASSNDLKANDFPEIDADARVVVKEIIHGGRAVIIFGTHTKSRQLILYAYDKESSQLLGTQYLGQTDPYRMGDLIGTEDSGLAVVAETSLSGRFSRICLFKLSAEEVTHLIRQ